MQSVWGQRPSLLGWLSLIFFTLSFSVEVRAQAQNASVEMRPLDENRLYRFRSDHFELYTDLEPRDTLRVLDRIEAVASNLGVFLGQPLKGKVKCFVVSDLNSWPAELLSDQQGRARVAQKAGAIVFEPVTDSEGKATMRPVVYTIADEVSPQRYLVQAFCWQNYGCVGAEWFSEGLSEMAAYWQQRSRSNCPAWMSDYLLNNSMVSPREVIDSATSFEQPWQARAQRWCLCSMLVSHPRYTSRFRQFSRDQVQGKNPDFVRVFPEIDGQMIADYREFLQRLGNPGDRSLTSLK